MTPALYVLAATGVALVAFGAVALVHLARDYADDRLREERFATEWQAAHRHNQSARYLSADDRRPE